MLFGSAHQWPHYPGSGFFTECGEGDGEGFTVNVPLPAGADDGDYAARVRRGRSTPSCGSSRRRPSSSPRARTSTVPTRSGDMRVDEAGFAQMALRCVRLAQELCDGKLAFVLEGGYDRTATAHAVEAVLRTVLDESAPDVPAGAGGTEKAAAAVARAREVQSAYWRL